MIDLFTQENDMLNKSKQTPSVAYLLVSSCPCPFPLFFSLANVKKKKRFPIKFYQFIRILSAAESQAATPSSYFLHQIEVVHSRLLCHGY